MDDLSSIELQLDSIAHGGEAVGRHEGRVVFIPFGAPHERVRATLVEERKSFARARLDAVLDPSPARCEAPCPYFTRCGGCQLQHLDYAAQLEAKRNIVADALRRIGKLDANVLPVIPSPLPLRYRRRAEFVFAACQGGFFAPRSHDVVEVTDCLLLTPTHQRLFSLLRALALGGAVPSGDPKHPGNMRRAQTLVSADDAQALVCLETARTLEATVTTCLRERVPELRGVLQRTPSHRRARCAWGEPWIEERVAGTFYRISLDSFAQVNAAMLEPLVLHVLKAAQLRGGERVADLYAGYGLFACALAARANEVVAVEVYKSACQDAEHNLRANRLTNLRVVKGLAERVTADWATAGERFDLIVLDPPRAGAAEAVQSIPALGAARIVYVSCDPATLARDILVLVNSGYEVEGVQPLDLFPQTAHIETVATLTRSG